MAALSEVYSDGCPYPRQPVALTLPELLVAVRPSRTPAQGQLQPGDTVELDLSTVLPKGTAPVIEVDLACEFLRLDSDVLTGLPVGATPSQRGWTSRR